MEPASIIADVLCLLLIFSAFANGQSGYSDPEYPDAPAAFQPQKNSGASFPPDDYTDYHNPPTGFNGNNPPADVNGYNNPPTGLNGFPNIPGMNGFNIPNIPRMNGFNIPNIPGMNGFNFPNFPGLNGFNNPAGSNGFNNPAGLNGFYNPPAGSTGYNPPSGPTGYNPPAGPTEYNAPAGPAEYNPPAYNPPAGHAEHNPPPYNPPASHTRYNPPPGHTRYNPSAGPTGYNPPAGSNGYNSPAGSNGYNSPAGSNGYNSPAGSNPPSGPSVYSNPPAKSRSDGPSNGKNTAPSTEHNTRKHSQPKRRVASTHHGTSTQPDSPCSHYQTPGHIIVCLFNNRHWWRGGFRPGMMDPCLCDILNYEFATLDPKSYEMIPGEPDLDCEEDMYTEATDLKKVNPHLKIFLSVGGWDDSTKKYSEMAADPIKRRNFVVKAVEFLLKHEFDGLDVAWEYPNCWQGAIGANPNDKPNFVHLLRELRSEVNKYGLGLSMSGGPIKREIEAAYDIPAIVPLVDHINVMAYDLHGPWEPVTGHHTQFSEMYGDEDPYCNVKAAMNFWVHKGAPKKKLNMGIAYYAKTFRLNSPARCVMGASACGIGEPGPVSQNGGFMLYNEMCQLLNAGNWTEYEHKGVGFYACCGDQFACYDPPMMVVKKAKWVVEQGYYGVLLKDMSGDDFEGKCFNMPFPLTKMCRLEMAHQIKKQQRRG